MTANMCNGKSVSGKHQCIYDYIIHAVIIHQVEIMWSILRLLPERGKSITKLFSIGFPLIVIIEHIFRVRVVHGKPIMIKAIQLNIF